MQESGLVVSLVKGYVRAEARRAGVEPVVVETELSSASDGDWHYVSVDRALSSLSLTVDDRYREEAALSSPPDLPPPSPGALHFGAAAGVDAEPLKFAEPDLSGGEGSVLDWQGLPGRRDAGRGGAGLGGGDEDRRRLPRRLLHGRPRPGPRRLRQDAGDQAKVQSDPRYLSYARRSFLKWVPM